FCRSGCFVPARSSRFQSNWARGLDNECRSEPVEARSELQWRRPPPFAGLGSKASSAATLSSILREVLARWISRLLRSGVHAILSRTSDPDDVLSAIYASYDGLVLLSTATAESLAAVYGDQPLEVEAELSEEITSRETDVLRMLAQGLVNKDIAARLGISEHTVKFHISSILDKLGASTRTEAVTVG